MADEANDANMAECGACREVISVDSASCPKCGVSFGGVSDEPLGACGACGGLAALDAPKCPHCGVSFVADNVIEVLGNSRMKVFCDDLLLCLISGGGSSLMTVPQNGLNMNDLIYVTKDLLNCGAEISEINCT